MLLLRKGADSIMFERLAKDGREFEEQTRQHINQYADTGLRTLLLAYREIDEKEYNEFNREFTEAKSSVSADREEMLEEVAEKFEWNLILLGATAVEDKLQNGVPECIDKLAQAGIKIWVLTGDKMETAINIGFACSLLRQGMKQVVISSETPEYKTIQKMEDKNGGQVCCCYGFQGKCNSTICYNAQDVYHIGTLMELVRVIALSFADDGKRVKVCVQGSMGQGALAGMPLQLSGTRKILEFMDWGEYGALGTFIQIGYIVNGSTMNLSPISVGTVPTAM